MLDNSLILWKPLISGPMSRLKSTTGDIYQYCYAGHYAGHNAGTFLLQLSIKISAVYQNVGLLYYY